jgi:hypothetical protein
MANQPRQFVRTSLLLKSLPFTAGIFCYTNHLLVVLPKTHTVRESDSGLLRGNRLKKNAKKSKKLIDALI